MSVRRLWQKPRRFIVAWVARLGIAVCRIVPGSLLIRLSQTIGHLAYYCMGQNRRRALDNLERVYGERLDLRERRRIAKACFAHFGEALGENLYLRRGEAAFRSFRADFEGLEHVETVLAQGRGVLFVTGHIGNWEIFGLRYIREVGPAGCVAMPFEDNPRLQKIIDEHRRRIGYQVFYTRGTDMVALARSLRKNQSVVLLADLRTRGKGVMAPFLGIPAHTQVGAAALAARTGAGLIVAHGHRVGPKHHRLVFEEPLSLDPPDAGPRDPEAWERYLLETTTRINERLTACIMERPEQWMWMHRRFPKPTARHDSNA